jgi:hypothetical protein
VSADDIREDSPRIHENRNDWREHEADNTLRQVRGGRRSDTHSLWEQPERTDNGMRVPPKVARIANSVPAKTLEAKGWRYLGPSLGSLPRQNLDEPIALTDLYGNPTGETMTKRQHLEGTLDAQAHILRPPGDRYTGRRFLVDGEIVRETENDADMVGTSHGETAFDHTRAMGGKP